MHSTRHGKQNGHRQPHTLLKAALVLIGVAKALDGTSAKKLHSWSTTSNFCVSKTEDFERNAAASQLGAKTITHVVKSFHPPPCAYLRSKQHIRGRPTQRPAALQAV